MSVGERLQGLRGSTKQGDFARKIGVQQSLLSEVERGVRRASLDFIEKARDKLGVSIDWLLTGKGEPYPKAPRGEHDPETAGVAEKPPEYLSDLRAIAESLAACTAELARLSEKLLKITAKNQP